MGLFADRTRYGRYIRAKPLQTRSIARMPETIGVISDTHGLLRPEAIAALEGCDRIIHAGDVGSADILNSFADLAPVVAVRGNVDKGTGRSAAMVGGRRARWSHHPRHPHPRRIGSGSVARRYQRGGVRALASSPRSRNRDGVLFLNPGSAGPRRFKLPVSVARMSVVDGRLTAQLIPLDPVTP